MTEIPRWAFERVEEERCRFLKLKPNPLNIDVWIRDPIGWHNMHIFAAYIARTEKGPAHG